MRAWVLVALTLLTAAATLLVLAQTIQTNESVWTVLQKQFTLTERPENKTRLPY